MSQYVYSPFNGLNQLHRELGRFFEPTNTAPATQGRINSNQGDWAPEVDIIENAQSYQLLVDLPGIEPSEVNITIDKNLLSISGKRKNELPTEDKGYKRRERVTGSFLRQFTLSESADSENINAKSAHGVLEINIPKQSNSSPINIIVEN